MEDNLGSYDTEFDYETSNGNAGMTLPVKVRPIWGNRSCKSFVGHFTINNRMLFYSYQYAVYSVLCTLLWLRSNQLPVRYLQCVMHFIVIAQ